MRHIIFYPLVAFFLLVGCEKSLPGDIPVAASSLPSPEPAEGTVPQPTEGTGGQPTQGTGGQPTQGSGGQPTQGNSPARNVLFFFRDPTGSLDALNWTVFEGYAPPILLLKVKIENYPDADIYGFWSQGYSPWCPISSIYADTTAYGTFTLPPGQYRWRAESVTTQLPNYPGLFPAFVQYWSTPHSAEGELTVQPGDNCILKEIVFN